MRRASKFLLCALCVLCASLFTGCAFIQRNGTSSETWEWYRPDGTLAVRRTVLDRERGGAAEFLEHDTLTNLSVLHSNQSRLGGYSRFGVGAATTDISTNAAPVIGAAGTAVGNVIGAAAKSAIK